MPNHTFTTSYSIRLAPDIPADELTVYLHGDHDVAHRITLNELVDDLIELADDDRDPRFQASFASTPAQLRAMADRIEAALSVLSPP